MINSINGNRLGNSIGQLKLLKEYDLTKEERNKYLDKIINDLIEVENNIKETQELAWDLANKLSYIK